MGWKSHLDFEDSRSEQWLGEHRPELIDLGSLFRHLVELEPELAPSAEQWRIALPEEAELIRLLGARTAHIRFGRPSLAPGPDGPRRPSVEAVPAATTVRDVVVKLLLPADGPRLLRWAEQVRHSRAQRAYLWSYRLRALGLQTPRPLGYLERAKAPALEKSFVVTEYVLAPALLELRDRPPQLVRRQGQAVLERRALIRRMAESIRELHAHGLCHDDLHPTHLLVPAEGRLMFLKPERVRRRSWSATGVDPSLAQLAAHFPMLTRTDRLRFVDTYLAHAADRSARRRDLFTALRPMPPPRELDALKGVEDTV